MDLTFNDRQKILKSTAHEFFAKECPLSAVGDAEQSDLGFSRTLWRRMADLGWLGLTYPERYGGGGASFLDLYVIYEEMGRFLVPAPHLATVILVGETLLKAGSQEQKLAYLQQIARGERIATAAVAEPSGTPGPEGVQLSARRKGDGFVLNGTKLLVPYAQAASDILCLARTGGSGAEGVSLFLVDRAAAGVSLEPLPNIAGEKLFAVTLRDVTVPQDRLVGPAGSGWPAFESVLSRASVLTCGMVVGCAEHVLEMTTEYAKQRVQSGRPIGQFQAVQNMCVDIAADTQLTRLLARQAAWALDQGLPSQREVATARAFASRAVQRVTRLAHDVHAGVGFMLQHPLPMYTRRAKHWELALGDPRYHHEQMAEALSL
ncbi:MAG: acyl-CoA/acyl-ACP dehydrogenase [Chloroflexi bacterium]|nr:acyl-CoA/acyl-ACP dehydrogenase [Chloroflexota bacterium]